MTGRVLRDSFAGNVSVMRQVGPHDVVPVAVPCLIGVTLDVDQLVKKLGAQALKSKGRRATAFYGALVVQVKEITP